MIGAIAGDVIGSVYEFKRIKRKDFPLFGPGSELTDDSVLTLAVALCLLTGRPYAAALKEFGRKYPDRGYGGGFLNWLSLEGLEPYNSFGNGAAMRVSPVGFAGGSAEEVLEEAQRSAAATHDHPEGIKGAQATALAIHLARGGADKEGIRKEISARFGYDLDRTVDRIRPGYHFDETCQGTVPEAIVCFLDSGSYEDAVRNAVSLGGDSDTLACITGGIAEAFYRSIPAEIVRETLLRVPAPLLPILKTFEARFRVLPDLPF